MRHLFITYININDPFSYKLFLENIPSNCSFHCARFAHRVNISKIPHICYEQRIIYGATDLILTWLLTVNESSCPSDLSEKDVRMILSQYTDDGDKMDKGNKRQN